VTEEEVDNGSTDVEPKMTAEGRSSETTGEDSDGTFPNGLMDDDRYKMVTEGSVG
jgi:hypothetical protein